MKKIPPVVSISTVLVVLALATTSSAVTPTSDDAPPQRPAHGALSSVAARLQAAIPPAPTAKELPRDAIDGYVSVGFDQLAGFPFESPPIQTADAQVTAPKSDVMRQVPDSIKKLADQKVTITGFMMPTKIENGLATEFLLLKSPMMCCFGITPSTNAWIVVKMPKGAPPIQDVPLPFFGRLHVREQWENGWLASIYQLDGEEPVKPHS